MSWFQNGLLYGLAGVAFFFVFVGLLKAFIKVSLPNKIFVVTGRKRVKNGRRFGFSVERGRTTAVPFFQQVGFLDLGVLPINVRVEGVNSANGITVGADATACVCIDDDSDPMLYSAVERLMGKDRARIKEQIQQTLVGNFRGALNKATPLQAIGMLEAAVHDGAALAEVASEAKKPDLPATAETRAAAEGERAKFRNELLKDSNGDLANFGMKVVSVSLQKIWDTSNYIGNLAQKMLAQKRRQVEIEEARLRAIAEQTESDSTRRIGVAKSKADELIIAARQKLEVYRQEADAQIQRATLEADSSILEMSNRSQRDVQELVVELAKLTNVSNVVLEEDAKKQAAEILASGDKEAVTIVEQSRNAILSQKAELIHKAGSAATAVLFMKQKLPALFEAYMKYAQKMEIDSLVVMDDKQGLNGAVNRGPLAFVDFIKRFEEALGVSIKSLMGQEGEEGRS
jgi:flotillin